MYLGLGTLASFNNKEQTMITLKRNLSLPEFAVYLAAADGAITNLKRDWSKINKPIEAKNVPMYLNNVNSEFNDIPYVLSALRTIIKNVLVHENADYTALLSSFKTLAVDGAVTFPVEVSAVIVNDLAIKDPAVISSPGCYLVKNSTKNVLVLTTYLGMYRQAITGAELATVASGDILVLGTTYDDTLTISGLTVHSVTKPLSV